MHVHQVHYCIHGHAIRTAEEVGGRCCGCNNLLCNECSKTYRCKLCGDILCRRCSTRCHDGFMCKSHNILSKFIHVPDWSVKHAKAKLKEWE